MVLFSGNIDGACFLLVQILSLDFLIFKFFMVVNQLRKVRFNFMKEFKIFFYVCVLFFEIMNEIVKLFYVIRRVFDFDIFFELQIVFFREIKMFLVLQDYC